MSDWTGRLVGRLRVDEARTKLWPAPAAALVAAVLLGIVLPRVDSAVDDSIPPWLDRYLFGAGADGARSVLSAMVGSLITVTSLTFSLTVITLQLASSQYSPRLLRTFSRDRFVHRTLAVFLASFVYALTVLRTVRSPSEEAAFVPQISVTVAYALCVVSVLSLVFFLAHLAQEIRVETILRNVHRDAADTFRRVLGSGLAPEEERQVASALETGSRPGAPAVTLVAPGSGFLVETDLDALCQVATDADTVVVLHAGVGDSLVQGTPVAEVRASSGALAPEAAAALQEALGEALVIRFERQERHDLGLGLRQIADVATRALSPGLNDPTTAVHALGHAASLLCDLLERPLRPEVARDGHGSVRVIVPRPLFPELLDLSVSQPRSYGARDPFVLDAVLRLLLAVGWVATLGADRDAVRDQLVRTRRVVADAGLDRADEVALTRLADSVADALEQVGGSS